MVVCLWLYLCGFVFVVALVVAFVCGCVFVVVFVVVGLWLCGCDCGCGWVFWLKIGREYLDLKLAG